MDLNIWDNSHFKSIITVNPISDPQQMYRLHKMFTEIELQRTYQEIEKLQVSCSTSVTLPSPLRFWKKTNMLTKYHECICRYLNFYVQS